MRRTRNVAGGASSSQSPISGGNSRATAGQNQQNKTQRKLKTKPLSARNNNITRRSQRILNFHTLKSVGKGKQQVCDLDDTSSEVEVVELLEPVVIQLHTSENLDAQKNKGGRGRIVKRTGKFVNKPRKMNNGFSAAPTEQLKQVNDADPTEQVVNNCTGLDDDAAPSGVDISGKNREQESGQMVSDANTIYKTLYRKAMRRLEAVTEERNVLSRLFAVAETKIGVLNDFRDQLNEVNKRLDIANERLEVYQKTMNPQVVELLREVLATSTARSQSADVPWTISSSKDASLDKATKRLTGSSKNMKCHKH